MTSGGQGGMVVSKDRNLIDEIRDYREFDFRKLNLHAAPTPWWNAGSGFI